MITVILLCYKRFQHFEKILKFWVDQEKVGQVIVFDNSGSFKTDLPVLVISASENQYPLVRFTAAQFAKHDHIIFCDDDIQPRDGIVKDLLAHFDSNRIVGIMGKQFTGETYKSSPTREHVTEPVEVDYIPANLCLVHRKHCLIDMQDCSRFPLPLFMDDWWWQHKLQKLNNEISLWVIPTRNYSIYSESSDQYAISRNPKVLELREVFFQKWIKDKK